MRSKARSIIFFVCDIVEVFVFGDELCGAVVSRNEARVKEVKSSSKLSSSGIQEVVSQLLSLLRQRGLEPGTVSSNENAVDFSRMKELHIQISIDRRGWVGRNTASAEYG